MNKFFPDLNMNTNFGFGCLRLPLKDGEIDVPASSAMIDAYLDAGFNYFDTAHNYISEKSETAVRDCLTSRYPRDRYILTNKLTSYYFNKQEDIRPLFELQLKCCGVDYFDFYLMHSQSMATYAHFNKSCAYETALELQAEGKFKHFGISFHDKAELLEQILNDYPQIEVVQIQFNYVDYDDHAVESRKCYDVCVKYGKPVMVMEPIKGGSLINLPPEALKIFNGLHTGTPASYALRFAGSFENNIMVLSGMGDIEQVRENVSIMKNFTPLNDVEHEAICKVRDIFRAQNLIPCTACHYCTDGCPKHIAIPELFACLNSNNIHHHWNAEYYYRTVLTTSGNKASDCIKCGKCENACPQHLKIRELLEQVTATFERGK